MSATVPQISRSSSLYNGKEVDGIDWLLHSKKDVPSLTNTAESQQDAQKASHPPNKQTEKTDTKSSSQDITLPAKAHIADTSTHADSPRSTLPNGTTTTSSQTAAAQRTDAVKTANEAKQQARAPHGTPKKEGRRSSWISSLGHKLSGGSNASKNDSQAKSPKHEFSNPFDQKANKKDERKASQDGEQPAVVVPSSPRRPSVLVAAGTETKVDNPGFLGTLRRLSSGNVSMGKGAGSGAPAPRRVMNIDHHRERVKIADLDQNKLKRVAFCVDVEIAGVAAQSEENLTQVEPVGQLPKSNSAQAMSPTEDNKDVKSAKYKEKGEGAALKNPQTACQEKDQFGTTSVDKAAEMKEQKKERDIAPEGEVPPEPSGSEATAGDQAAPATTRKKEKKKRSEAERRERKERKRRHAEQNGLVPLEIMREDDDSDTTLSNTPSGAHTPRKNGDQPTTDPLRIYKRCCQLRETTALSAIKEQIVQPSATLAESPGTVAIIDLAGAQMTLSDITTLGDWLAVVPVRKLILDNCNLTDEGIRVILSGLLGCKTSTQARYNRKLNKNGTGKPLKEQMGFLEKLSLKNNSSITSIGWKHIALFMHMSKSLVAIDLTGIPYPRSPGTPSALTPLHDSSTHPSNGTASAPITISKLVARAIAERLGEKLEELILTNCGLSSDNVADLVDAAIRCKIRRLGLAANKLSGEGLEHVVQYVTSGVCEGLDLGSNDLHNTGQFLTKALDENNPLFALSVSNCNLEPSDLKTILPRFTTLRNFKFIDLSRNRGLFNGDETALPLFRKYIPKMPALKRIHLADVALQPDHVIALAEMFPDCLALCHVNIIENESLVQVMNSKSAEQQEEAAAFLASLMTAVRVSQTIVAIEIEVPSSESSEVVRALASQIVAYSLRNMDRSVLTDMGVAPNSHLPDKNAPEVLLHLVGHMEGYNENHDNDEPAPDEDYMIASTGIAKALGVCLRNQGISRTASRNISPAGSGTATPRKGSSDALVKSSSNKPRDVGLELCESARKIRMRLRPALVKEDRAGNREAYMRLAALDATLQRIIQRFEDEYPDAKPQRSEDKLQATSPATSPDISRVNSVVDGRDAYRSPNDEDGEFALKLSRTSSNTSLAAKALTSEEGRMHRFGQSMRRELLKPTGKDDYAHDPPEAEHFTALRKKLEKLDGEEIRQSVEEYGADEVIKQLGLTADELRAYRLNDPEAYELLKESHMAANMNVNLAGTNGTARENRS